MSLDLIVFAILINSLVSKSILVYINSISTTILLITGTCVFILNALYKGKSIVVIGTNVLAILTLFSGSRNLFREL